MIDKTWFFDLHDLYYYGNPVSPRGILTREILGHTCQYDMNYPMLANPMRSLNYKFMAAEAYWILSGSDRVDEIAPYMKRIADYSDNGETFFGAYGPKVVSQLAYVVKKLDQDPDTRQAVLTIWRENPAETKDYPCTISMIFMIRNGSLDCHVTMRSNDIWLGRPYDVFNFSMIAHVIRLRLAEKYTMGTLYLTAASLHLYESNVKMASKLLDSEIPESEFITFDSETNLMASLDKWRNQ